MISLSVRWIWEDKYLSSRPNTREDHSLCSRLSVSPRLDWMCCKIRFWLRRWLDIEKLGVSDWLRIERSWSSILQELWRQYLHLGSGNWQDDMDAWQERKIHLWKLSNLRKCNIWHSDWKAHSVPGENLLDGSQGPSQRWGSLDKEDLEGYVFRTLAELFESWRDC